MKIRSRLFLYTTLLVLITAAVAGAVGYSIGAVGFRSGTKSLLIQLRLRKSQEVKREFENIGKTLVSLAEVTALRDLVPKLSIELKELKKKIPTSLKNGNEFSEISRYYSAHSHPEIVRAITRIPAPAAFLQAKFINEAKVRGILPPEVSSLRNPPPFRYFKTVAEIQPYYLDINQKSNLEDLIIVDSHGEVVYSVAKGLVLGTNLRTGVFADSPLARAFRWSLTASPSDYRIFDLAPILGRHSQSYFYLAIPIYQKSQVVGSIIAQIAPSFIDGILSENRSWLNLGLRKSGEIVLVGKDGLLRTNSRRVVESGGSNLGPYLTPEIAEFKTVALQLGYAQKDVQNWVRAQEGLGNDTDYLNNQTLRSFGRLLLPGVEWVVIAKIDQHETLPSPLGSWPKLIFLCALVGLLLICGAYYLASQLSGPVNRLKQVLSQLRHPRQDLANNDEHQDDELTPLIKELNQISECLRQATEDKKYFSNILNSIDDFILVVDAQTQKIKTINPSTSHLLGIPTSSIIDTEVSRWIKTESNFLEPSNSQVTAHLKSAFGELIPAKISWAHLQEADKASSALVISGTDQRLLKEDERISALKETFFQDCQSVSKIGSFHWDITTEEMIWSEETYRNLGLDSQKFKPSLELFRSQIVPEDQPLLDKNIREALCGQRPFMIDLRIKKIGNQDITWLRCTARTDLDDSGRAVRIYGTNQDITIIKKTELACIIARNEALNSSKAKSEFLARMSHEIRTPMNAIMGMADLLKETPLNEEQQYFVTIFCKAGEVLMALINDILDLSKIEAGEVTIENIPFDLEKLLLDIQDIMKPRALDKRIEYSFSLSPQISPFLMGDPTKLRQILINLVSNSIKFTEKGSVRLTIGRNPSKKDYLLVSVTDTGLGIPTAKQHVIFQKFSQADSTITRKYGGTGLGLAISKSLTELMGGQIWFKSREALGTSFFITIPYHEQITHPVTHKPLPMRASELKFDVKCVRDPNKKLRILLADDTEDNRILFSRYLKDGPFEIIEAENGLEAIDKIKSGKFDIVFMDVQMPELDGYAATEIIRQWEKSQHQPPVPIIALTAHALSEDRSKSLKVGCDEHITKPFKKNTILSVIQKYS